MSYSIGGNIFSALCFPTKSMAVGASTAIYGLIACLVALVVVNWKSLGNQPEVRCCLIIGVVFILMFSLLASVSSGDQAGTVVDFYGHLGGLITGFFFACIVMPQFRGAEAHLRGSYESKVKYLGIAGSVFCFILFFTLFFALNVIGKKLRC